MKKWILGVLVLGLCVGPASAGSVTLFGSSYSPDDTDTGEGVGIGAVFGEGRSQFLMRFTLYDELVTVADPEVYQIQAFPIDFGVNWNFGGGEKVKPYGGVGLTYSQFDFNTDVTITGGLPRGVDIDPEIGFYGQVGLAFLLNDSWQVTAEALYRTLKAQVEGDDIGLPINQKVSLSGVAVNFGIGVHW